jgi:hypothetical protein
MSGLGSAPVPPIDADDHVLGPAAAPVAIVYADYECPHCAVLKELLVARGEPWAFRHFPVRSTHPRSHAAACAAEAAALQGAFEAMHMSLFADQARLEDPHLWARAERLGLDVARSPCSHVYGATSRAGCAPESSRRRRASTRLSVNLQRDRYAIAVRIPQENRKALRRPTGGAEGTTTYV